MFKLIRNNIRFNQKFKKNQSLEVIKRPRSQALDLQRLAVTFTANNC